MLASMVDAAEKEHEAAVALLEACKAVQCEYTDWQGRHIDQLNQAIKKGNDALAKQS